MCVCGECTFIYLSPHRWQLNATLLPSGESSLPLAVSRVTQRLESQELGARSQEPRVWWGK